MVSAVCERAPAKVNLYLEVLHRRGDGYHELETVFQTIDLCDRVTVSLRADEQLTLRCDDPSLPADQRNLAWRAAQRYREAAGLRAGVDIVLEKRIPAGAGLGGGSADAAAVLRALERLGGRPLGRERLRELAAELGSDVPFCLEGGTAHATGRGERLQPLPPLPPLPLTVLLPEGAACATPAVYAALSEEERGPRPARGWPWFAARLAEPERWLHNRLTAAACRVCPALDGLLAWLAERGAAHCLTGSGAACIAFGHLAPPAGVRAWFCHCCA